MGNRTPGFFSVASATVLICGSGIDCNYINLYCIPRKESRSESSDYIYDEI